jgi:O-antigen ligase
MPASRSHLFLDWLLAFGVLLALETQLRSDKAIAGPGEILLVCWIVAQLGLQTLQSGLIATRAAIDICAFWAIFAFALCLGSIQIIASGELPDISLVLHDVIAYSLVAAISLLLTLGPDAEARLRQQQWSVMLAASALLILQLANAAGLFAVLGVDPWYWDRLRGWTANPNQFALLCLLIAFLSLHLADVETRMRRAVAILCCALALVGGWLAKSNAYAIVVVGGLGIFMAVKALRLLGRLERRRSPALPIAAAAAALAAFCALVTLSLDETGGGLFRDVGSIARDSRNDMEDSSVRIELWKQALQRGADSWMLGLGPGPHLEIPNIILAGRRSNTDATNIQHPKAGLAANFESHNTLLELFVQSGLVGVCAFLWITGLALWRSWRAEADGMMAALLALNVFGSFHVVFRHPFLWFLICGALAGSRLPLPAYARRRTTAPFAASSMPVRFKP